MACCEHFSSKSFRIYQLTLSKDARIRQLLFLYQSHNNQVSSPSTVLIIILARPPPITWTDFFAAFQSQTRERSSCSPSLIVMLLFSLIILLAGVFFDHLQQSSLCVHMSVFLNPSLPCVLRLSNLSSWCLCCSASAHFTAAVQRIPEIGGRI